MGRFGYYEETSPSDLINDEAGLWKKKMGQQQAFQTGKKQIRECVRLLVLNYSSQQGLTEGAFSSHLQLKESKGVITGQQFLKVTFHY